ncbi:hypothetical protein V6N11_013026 [Hibiscus sabdariffa]|uniref:Uncharacterized protein n=1 Tax=Hibiscus sabdariffa TaxID=183260 RepID=A0ABR2NCI2_9ROSI
MKMKFSNAFYVDPKGIVRGLAFWWTGETKIEVLLSQKNIIGTKLSIHGEEDWFCSFIYSPSYIDEKKIFWESLSNLGRNGCDKWCIIGDVNIVARPSDKLGGAPFDHTQAKCFSDFLDREGLMELPMKGGNFTCSNKRSERDAILEKLDRTIVLPEWCEGGNSNLNLNGSLRMSVFKMLKRNGNIRI